MPCSTDHSDEVEAETVSATWKAELDGSGIVQLEPDYSDHGRVWGEVLTEPAL